MTAAEATFSELLSIAVACGCSGIELRTDVDAALFDGMSAAKAAEMAGAQGLRIFALAEVKSFNYPGAQTLVDQILVDQTLVDQTLVDQTLADTEKLADIARACGCEAIVLIPFVDEEAVGNFPVTDECSRKEQLKKALLQLIPILEKYDVQGFVEPLGFTSASLRSKREVVEVIDALGARERIKLIHDTFHHFLAGEPEFYPEHTGMVHISGVTDPNLGVDEMQDKHRVLVNTEDQIRNTEQLKALAEGGYTGPVSVEAFATEVHKIQNLAEHLRDSFQFINSGLASRVA